MSYTLVFRRWLALLLVAIGLLVAPWSVGCSRPSEVPQTESEIHLKAFAVLYGRYVGSHRGQTPPSEADFKKYIQGLPKEQLDALKVTAVDSLFVSPRDGQPYVVKYKIALPPPGPQGAPLIAHEQTGQGGKRYVANSLGDVQLVDESKFQELAKN